MRLIAALENQDIELPLVQENDPVAPEEAVVEQQLMQTETAAAEMASEVDSASEVVSVKQSTDSMIETVAASVDSGTGMAPETTEIVEAAMEHMYTRMGYTPKKRATIANEDFKSDSLRLNATMLALEEMKDFSKRLDNGLTIAQEGMLARFGNSIKLLFTSSDKIQRLLTENVKEIESKGAKEGMIDEPGWGRSFAQLGVKELDGAAVLAYVSRVEKLVTSSDFINLINGYTDICRKVESEVSRSWFIAKDKAVEAIRELTDDADKVVGIADKLFISEVLTAKNDPSFKALTVQEAKKLAELAKSITNDRALNQALHKLEVAIDNVNVELYNNSNMRLAKFLAADIRAAKTVINKINPTLSVVYNITSNSGRLAFASARYIKSSTNK